MYGIGRGGSYAQKPKQRETNFILTIKQIIIILIKGIKREKKKGINTNIKLKKLLN